MKSTHRVEVVPIRLEPHPNADSLSIVRVFDGYTCCVRTADWEGKTRGAYIPPDSVVDSSRPEFVFLAGHERIRVKKLRGMVSMGLLIPVSDDAPLGADLAEELGVTHYEPLLPASSRGEAAPAPAGYRPVYDVETLRRYAHVFVPGEAVWITEKIHGASARYVWADDKLHVGSRTEWKRESRENLWWKVVESHPMLTEFCRAHPDITVYGEVYGNVQDLKYGTTNGEVRLAVFDLLRGSEWLNAEEARIIGRELPWVPLISAGVPFDLERILELAEGASLIAGASHIREGIVVRPLIERTHPEVGRVCLKVVANGYLER
jgi:RNA ligase (TIGR02306 family)